MKTPAIPGDPRRAIGAVVCELVKAGCAWQRGDLALARSCARRAAVALDVVQVRLAQQRAPLAARRGAA